MWFGDLVTMQWFNDVWMKEVFANFMAGKIVNPSFPQVNHDLRFLLANYPAAYQVDRTAGSNPIRQPLANLEEAGQLYGADHLPEGADRDAAARARRRRGGVPRRAARVSEDVRVRQRHLDRPRSHSRRAHAGGSRRLEPRVGRGARPSRVQDRRCASTRGRVVASDADVDRSAAARPGLAAAAAGRARISQTAFASCRSTSTARRRRRRTREGLPRAAVRPAERRRASATDCSSSTRAAGSICWRISRTIPDPLTRGSAWVTLWDNVVESHVSAGDFMDLVVRALPRGDRRAERAARARLHHARLLAKSHAAAAVAACAGARGDAARRDRPRRDEQREVRLVLGVPRHRDDADRASRGSSGCGGATRRFPA